jgi:histidyl-tRNA synthetase
VGIEAIGIDDPALDAEVIAIADQGFKNLGLKNYRLEITSLGDAQSRAAHRVDLMKYISTLDLDEATRSRADLNPLRLFDDKRIEIKEAMQGAPILMDYLSEYSRNHFENVKSYLDDLNIAYVVNKRMVRGLDYYTGTTFEFLHDDLGAQSGIGGGGRYDGLMEVLGGQSLSGIGFGLGVDRAILAAIAENTVPVTDFTSDLFIIALGEGNKSAVLTIAADVRLKGFTAEVAFGDRSLKGAMKGADKSGARFVAVVGDSERESGLVELKRMSDGTSISVKISELQKVLEA